MKGLTVAGFFVLLMPALYAAHVWTIQHTPKSIMMSDFGPLSDRELAGAVLYLGLLTLIGGRRDEIGRRRE